MTLGPRRNFGATSEDGSAVLVHNCVCGPREINIVKYESTSSSWYIGSLGKGSDYAFRCTREAAVLDDDGANRLVVWTVGHVHADAAVVDANRFESPNPVPVHEDGGLYVVEFEIAGCKLLIS